MEKEVLLLRKKEKFTKSMISHIQAGTEPARESLAKGQGVGLSAGVRLVPVARGCLWRDFLNTGI